MTHGCLKIRRHDEERYVFLHTYHNGMYIPITIEEAPKLVAELAPHIENKDMASIQKAMRRSAMAERLTYAPSAASLIIAVIPGFLEPMPAEFIPDLPSWGGQDGPYSLIIGDEQSECHWFIHDEDGKIIKSFDAFQKVVDTIWLRNKEKPS